MSVYLLDSDIVIELLRGRSLHLAQKLSGTSSEQVSLCTVTVSELSFGARRSRDPDRSLALCRQFCSSFLILPLDEAAAERAAEARAYLEDRGQRIGAYDILIAGIALAHGQVLVTHNTREFERIPGLPLEDWAKVQ